MRRTPFEIAEEWYNESDIAREIVGTGTAWNALIPRDIQSPEFAKWLTTQYRLAMAKGIQLGREGEGEIDQHTNTG